MPATPWQTPASCPVGFAPVEGDFTAIYTDLRTAGGDVAHQGFNVTDVGELNFNAAGSISLPISIDQVNGPAQAIGIEPTVTGANNTSILWALYIHQTDKTKIDSNTYINGVGVNLSTNNGAGNQNAGVMSFMYSYGGADPFGADLHAIVPATATVAPAYTIGAQMSTQVDAALSFAGKAIYPAYITHDSAASKPCSAMIRLDGAGGSAFLMSNNKTAFTGEGIVLQPNDDLNPTYRVFAVVNAAGSQGNFSVSKDGTGYFRGGITQEAWTVMDGAGGRPALQNSWVAAAAPYAAPQYRKDTEGKVHLHGAMRNGTTTDGTLIVTLPAGYRPPASICRNVSAANADVRLIVATDGTVKIYGCSSATIVHLDGMDFFVA